VASLLHLQAAFLAACFFLLFYSLQTSSYRFHLIFFNFFFFLYRLKKINKINKKLFLALPVLRVYFEKFILGPDAFVASSRRPLSSIV